MLADHQQQLVKLTSQTEELVRSMQALTTQAAASAPPTASLVQPVQSMSLPTSNPRLSLPDKYDGSLARCKGFLLINVPYSSISNRTSILPRTAEYHSSALLTVDRKGSGLGNGSFGGGTPVISHI